ncbi:MAG TPA: acyl-CoA dehydrogenase family protein, partial [Rhizomicrobium sp.]
MEFGLSSDQKMMQESVERTLVRLAPLDRTRKAAETNAIARDVWDGLVELGAPAVLIPEEFGGLDLNLLDAALIAEALGRHVAPVPFVASAVMAPLALMQSGSPKQKSEWLPKLAGGKTLAGVAISESISGARDGAGVTASGGKLNGTSLFVIDSADADIFIVADKAGGLHLVDAKAKGVKPIPLETIDRTRSIGELQFENADAEPLKDGKPKDALLEMRDAAWVMLAADTLGASQRMIEKAVDYAKERKQFDRVIGSFQAVKHMCAEMAAELEPCRSLVWYAAYAFDAIEAE